MQDLLIPAKFAITIDNVFTKEECQEFIDLAEANEFSTALVNVGYNQQELMTELFFEIRPDIKESQFLKKDATIVMMEVNRHGMHQV